ncbi:hypothetical protein E2C01_016111 [Portunus trituberculatus]|uniref:Uncharacterized protein n=1 Tax=Portunus trituberculatus TaxID=210409 RepID=A0A5B7DPW3_PORTR|nr:hypothetical protein [Portunus trituberculatus]
MVELVVSSEQHFIHFVTIFVALYEGHNALQDVLRRHVPFVTQVLYALQVARNSRAHHVIQEQNVLQDVHQHRVPLAILVSHAPLDAHHVLLDVHQHHALHVRQEYLVLLAVKKNVLFVIPVKAVPLDVPSLHVPFVTLGKDVHRDVLLHHVQTVTQDKDALWDALCSLVHHASLEKSVHRLAHLENALHATLERSVLLAAQ